MLLQKEEKPKDKEKGKSRNIDHFMEELKHEQEMRERRNQGRDNSRDSRLADSSAVSVIYFPCYAGSIYHVMGNRQLHRKN